MFNKLEIRNLAASVALGLVFGFSTGPASAGDPPKCDTATDYDCDGIPNGKDPCPKDPKNECIVGLCHNIGGPRGLGANCENGFCAELVNPVLITAYNTALDICDFLNGDCDPNDIYAGIFVPHSSTALQAHINHGDTTVAVLIDSRIHDTQPHISANVDCFGIRVFSQPPEPGN